MKEIVDAMIYVLVIFIVFLLCFNICYAKLNNKTFVFTVKNLLLTLFLTIIMLLSTSINSISLKAMINLIATSLEFKLIYNDNIKRVLINYIYIYTLMVLIEIILTKFLFFAGIITNSTSANTLSHLNLGLTIVLSVIVYTLISVKFFREFLQRMINFFLDNKPITNVIYLI